MTREVALGFIERGWIRFRQRQEGKALRDYLKTIPYECRRSYVKYFDLKFKTLKLKTEVDHYGRLH